MKSPIASIALALAAIVAANGCRKKAPPNVIGTFTGRGGTLRYALPPGSPAGRSMDTQQNRTVSIVLSDEQAASTAVSVRFEDFLLSDIRCEGRAQRFDSDARSARYTVGPLECARYFENRPLPNPTCRMQQSVLGFRFDPASNALQVDTPSTVSYEPPGDMMACKFMISSAIAAGTTLNFAPPS